MREALLINPGTPLSHLPAVPHPESQIANPKSMKLRLTLPGLLATVLTLTAQETSFLEKFALSADRDAVLKELIPGTDDYYYYHALHLQNQGKKPEMTALLKEWADRFQNENARRREIENRQALINYSTDPAATLAYLRDRLGVGYNHQRITPDARPDLPVALDPALITWQAYLQQALNGHSSFSQVTGSGLVQILRSGNVELTTPRRRDLLNRIHRPDFPDLVKIINDDLGTKESKGFGEFAIHGKLTLAQLEELLKLRPALLQNSNFVTAWAGKLRPAFGEDAVRSAAVREAWLDRLEAFTSRLAPSFNSLKAHILYHRLVHDQGQGVINEAKLLAYLQLPRPVGYLRKSFRESDVFKQPVDLNANYEPLSGCAPIGNDEGLVRSLLLTVLAKADTAEKYAAYIENTWLNAVHAEAKLLSGAPDPQKWVSLLTPESYQALKDRVDLDFDAALQPEWSPAGEVALVMHVKNVPKLLVKVYEINTENVHRTTGAQVNTDLNLDGLTANSEQSHDYNDAPLLRQKRTFQFPELKGKRGVWIVEFIGGGKSSRALIRKGGLRHLVSHEADGTVIRVFDETMKPVEKSYVQLGTRRFDNKEDGRILIPFSERPGEQNVILGDGSGFTTLEKVNLAGENYELKAGFHVPRESLLPGVTAKLAIRPALLLNGRPTILAALGKVRLTISSQSLDGIPSTSVYDIGARDKDGKPSGPQLAEDGETLIEFTVPDRLASLSFSLEGEVKALGTGQPVKLSAGDSLKVNGITLTDQTSDLHLTFADGQFILEERGRTGEQRADREVTVTLTHRDFAQSKSFTLKTDAVGAIRLGALEGISVFTARSATGVERQFTLPRTWASLPAAVNVKAGEPVQVAWRGNTGPAAGDVSVLELRNGVPVRDASAGATVKGGLVTITGLTPGEYAVELAPVQSSTIIRVSEGETVSGSLVNGALTMELSNPAPLAITGMARGEIPAREDTPKKSVLVFHVGNAGVDTRVHVFASRFLPAFDAFGALGDDRLPQPQAWTNAWRPSLYQSARTIGEEYRYVLERRGAKHYAGNLLPRPGLLLNPWAISDTATDKQNAAAGEDARAMQAEKPAAAAAPAPAENRAKKDAAPAGPMDPDLSFLAAPGAVAFNLKPDKDGNVAIDAASLGDRQLIRVVAVDSDSAAARDFTLPAQQLTLRDLRLADGLDPKQHFSRQNHVTLLEKGAPHEFKDALTATWQNIGHLGTAHSLLYNLTNNATLAEFSWILNWNTMKPEQKAEMYSKYACHELHFFLARRDAEFFASVVKPFLANKRDKTFMDHYLLGADMSGYLRPWQYSRLNTVERVLLSRRIQQEVPVVRRALKDWLDTLPKNPQRDAFLFETALNGRVLSVVETGRPGGTAGLNNEFDFGGIAAGGFGGGGKGGAVAAGRRGQVDRFFADGAMPPPAPAGAVAGEPMDALSLGVRQQQEGQLKALTGLAEMEQLAESVELSDKDAGADRKSFRGRGLTEEKAKAVELRRNLAAAKAERLFRQTEQTKEWAENNYYRLLIAQQNAELVAPNRFWQDYAVWDGVQAFVSANLADATGSFTEMMLALAALDLPFPSEVVPGKVERKENSVTLVPAGKGILFHQEIRAAEPDKEGAQLLVSQNFYRHGDRYIEQAGEKIDKFVSAEFLTGVVYGCQVVVTNPSSSRQKLDLLFQIPQGAIPVLQTQATKSLPVALEPYHTQTFDFQFYFPAAGKFPHYPVHLSRNFKTAASAEPFTFNVVPRATQADKASWEYVSQNSEPAEVIGFLEQNNLYTLNLDLMAWRLSDVDFAKKALTLLRTRHVYHPTTWSYALQHNITEGVTDYLMHADGFLAQCGAYIDCALIKHDPVERRIYQHLEYSPLINARAHQLGARRQIMNDKLRGQFNALMKILSYRPALDEEDHLAAAYYLALQDRIEEAIERFARVDAAKVAEKLQYDYMQAWLAMCQADTATARRIATAHAAHPVDHWKAKFTELASQLDEIEGKAPVKPKDDDRDATQDRLAAQEPALNVKIENKTVTLNYRNLSEVTVNYYPMDLEFLFSANPFVTQDTSRFRMIRPNKSGKVMLPAGEQHVFALPAEYQSANVLVEITGGGLTKAEAAYANELDVQVSEGFGRLQVTHAGDKKPLSKVYVKVFADVNGTPTFYKDGYTDLRGKFDYASLSTSDLDGTTRFSVLIMSDQHGATVKEVQPPKR